MDPAAPIPLARVRTDALSTGDTVFVTGYPGAMRELYEGGDEGDGVKARFFAFPTPLVHAESLTFAWEPDHLVPKPGAESLPPTAGMSGGGVWTYRTGPGDPTPFAVDARLVGLVREETAVHREARANPIKSWLDMLAEDLPELREIIAAHRATSK